MGKIKKNVKKNTRKLGVYKYVKMLFDFLIALLGIIITSPIMLIIAIAIKLDSKGPVLFKQKRTGKNGKVFNMYKFRSMAVDNNPYDFSKKDERTKVGTFLRKTSLDELPQFFNIIKFEMSLIGPRPWIADCYDLMTDEQKRRHDVLPGITGLAQANGRNDLTIFDRINYDLEYIDNFSFMQDVKIIFLTIKAVLSEKGADLGKATFQSDLEALRSQHKKGSK